MSNGGWIGVDLDGTIAEYTKWMGADHIGKPIPLMVERVKRWIADGIEVRIFTARVSHDGTPARMSEAQVALHAVRQWCSEHVGVELPVTNVKDYAMVELWDDRAVRVDRNSGTIANQFHHAREGQICG